MPVEYSPVMTSTPSTPIASSAKCQPPIARSTGSKPRRSPWLIWFQCAICTAENRIPMPAIAITATSSDQRVDRSDQSLVHSERATRSCVTRPV